MTDRNVLVWKLLWLPFLLLMLEKLVNKVTAIICRKRQHVNTRTDDVAAVKPAPKSGNPTPEDFIAASL